MNWARILEGIPEGTDVVVLFRKPIRDRVIGNVYLGNEGVVLKCTYPESTLLVSFDYVEIERVVISNKRLPIIDVNERRF